MALQSTLFFAALDTRIRASVCSCYFNNRWNKLLEDAYLAQKSTRERLAYVSYLTTVEDDKFNPLAAPLWDDHVIASLICPRPFAVEIGRNDPVIYFRDALEEFGRLKRTYQTLGIEDRTEAIISEAGGHEMFYDAARLFLDRWLIADAC